MSRVYEEIVEFIANGTTPESVVAFRPSDAARQRTAELLARRKDGPLPPNEEAELNHFLELEHIMRLAKARVSPAKSRMSSYVAPALRRMVAERAQGLCEYCLIHEDDTFFGCQIEHVIAEKHGGGTVAENLAHACAFCNYHKGTDIASISPGTGQLQRLFNPRVDRWSEHFQLSGDGLSIQPLSDIGDVTIRILAMNHPDRLLERAALRSVGRYPSSEAMRLM